MDSLYKMPAMRILNALFDVRLTKLLKKTAELPVILDAMMLMRRHCNG